MATPDTQMVSRFCDLLLQEAFRRDASAISLEPHSGTYLIYAHNQGVREQVAAPRPDVSLALFVHLCQRAEVAQGVCNGSFNFAVDGQPRTVDLQVLNGPKGKRAELTLC